MHDSLFADSFHIPTFTVLGLKLRNYAIGHEIGLWKNRNPLVTMTPASFDELSNMAKQLALANAAEVCCYRPPFFKSLWAIRSLRLNLDTELKTFREYRLAGSLDLPTTKMPRQGGVPFHYFGAPEAARLLNYVASYHTRLIEEHFDGSPLNFPFGLARILYSTHLECEGAIWVENWQDAEIKRKRDELDKLNREPSLALGEDAVQAAAEKWNREHPECPVPLMREPKEKT